MTTEPLVPLEGGCTCRTVRYRTPAVAEYYDSAKYWPKESLERRALLRAAQPRT